MNEGRVEDGRAHIILVQKHPYLGATKDQTAVALYQ
jgi:hypothetical protein